MREYVFNFLFHLAFVSAIVLLLPQNVAIILLFTTVFFRIEIERGKNEQHSQPQEQGQNQAHP